VAIVYATQVNAKLATGDVQGAKRASDNAKRWSWVAFGLGVVTIFFWILAGLAGAMGQ
jgi:hypothetical protein